MIIRQTLPKTLTITSEHSIIIAVTFDFPSIGYDPDDAKVTSSTVPPTTTNDDPSDGGVHGSTIPLSCTSESLTLRRELVELLNAEPLLDYLVQNGILGSAEAKSVRLERSSVRQNLFLLKRIDDRRRRALLLFINSLRLTGQHYLANLLDDSTRINAAVNASLNPGLFGVIIIYISSLLGNKAN